METDASQTPQQHRIALFGAYGHTARFLIGSLHTRGFALSLGGRNPERMAEVAEAHPYARTHVATVEDPASLDALLAGASLVVNAAGPFGDTTPPLIEAALRVGVHYIDITGEQPVTRRSFETYRERLADSGLLFLPAFGFFGGLPDLLATAAMGDWAAAPTRSPWRSRWTAGSRRRAPVRRGRAAPGTGSRSAAGGWCRSTTTRTSRWTGCSPHPQARSRCGR
ncbi:saccharopine dehydrogenase NADP-binding domain-containing protein [Embleya sp. NPDC055664]